MEALEQRFLGAFDGCKPVLAAFAQCENQKDLDTIRDGFMMCMAASVCEPEYRVVTTHVNSVHAGDRGFQETVDAARTSKGWGDLLACVHGDAATIGSDLNQVWSQLEQGRLGWLRARAATQDLKLNLQAAGRQAGDTELNEAKMIWVYGLGTIWVRFEVRLGP